MPSEELIQALAVTAELCGTNLSDPAKRILLQDLSDYPERAVIAALASCRKQLKGRLSLAEIVSRIDDGRPGVEEAWAMLPRNEDATVVWTEEMSSAWGVALPLLESREEVAARMAFKERYISLVQQAREEKRPVKWSVSLGHDPNQRESALLDAASKGRLEVSYAHSLLPHHRASPQWLALLEGAGKSLKVITQ